MKRSPLRRTSGLNRGGKRINPVSDKRRKRDAPYKAAREAVFNRAQGRCEALTALDCSGACEQVHHLAGRGGSDPHRLSNLLGICAACHTWIGAHPAKAMELGLLRSRHR